MTTAVAAATMKAAQVSAAGAGLKIVELEVPDPGPGQVRIKVHACGVCYSDSIVAEGRRPGIVYPRHANEINCLRFGLPRPTFEVYRFHT